METMLHWTLWPLLALVCKGENECCPRDASFGGPNGAEQKAVQAWFDSVKGDWHHDFKHKNFVLWDEFDIRNSKDLFARLNGMDPSTTPCGKAFQKLRWDFGYKRFNPDLYDWDDKIVKKGIIAGMQPKGKNVENMVVGKNVAKHPWYLPLIYAAYTPSWTQEDQIEKLDVACKQYFKANPSDILFLKLAVSGSSGTGIPKCHEGQTKSSNMYRLFPGYTKKDLVHCVGLLKCKSEEPLPSHRNPALQYGYPGLFVEPGFFHHTEVKTLVIWGRLFAIGAEKPNCCAFYSNNNITFRGYQGDTRKAPDGRTYDQWMKEIEKGKPSLALLDNELLAQVKHIAEGVGRHADYIRVDMFVNTDTRKVVVNEIESFFGCNAFGLKTDALIEKLMSQIWLEGWQAYHSRGAITNVERPFSQLQGRIASGEGRFSGMPKLPKSHSLFFSILINIIWCCIAAGCFGIGWLVKSKYKSPSAGIVGDEEQVELSKMASHKW